MAKWWLRIRAKESVLKNLIVFCRRKLSKKFMCDLTKVMKEERTEDNGYRDEPCDSER